jgi:SAM-dependent methyltransferase
MINPLEEFKTKKVKDLLSDFYEANFVKAGVEKTLGSGLVNYFWENKDSIDEDILKEKCLEFFKKAKQQAHTGVDEIRLWTLFDFSNIETFLDIGANKLRYVNEIGDLYPHVKRLIGIDVVDQKEDFTYPEKSEYYKVDEEAKEFPIDENSVDLINIQFVFHHFPDEKSINRMLENCNNALKKGGRLILWEESFESDIQLEKVVLENESLGIHTNLEFMSELQSFTQEEKWEFVIANDWLINVNNSHMQWTGLYKEWKDWVEVLNSKGFQLSKVHNIGLRVNGQLKQGLHIIGEFKKT